MIALTLSMHPLSLPQVTVLRGHKRGVWAVEFAPLERAILTASGELFRRGVERPWHTGDLYQLRRLQPTLSLMTAAQCRKAQCWPSLPQV